MGDSSANVPAIGIDGFNLVLPYGTGVATYGYGVAEVVRSLGMPVHGVFGVPVGREPALREILYYEAMGRGIPRRGGPRWLRPIQDWLAVMQGLSPADVVETGRIERRGFADRLPVFDRLTSAAHLFERAEGHFRRTQRFIELKVPNPPAIMHWTYPVPLRIAGARNIYTLHDLVPLKLPFATLDRKRLYYRLVARCVRDADHIVTVSEASRRDIIDLFDAPADRVTNTYQHAPMPPAMGDDADIAAIFGVQPENYFIYFGAVEPKKNVGRLVEAYLSTNSTTPLVLVAGRAWQEDDEMRLVETMKARTQGPGPRIIQLEYLPRRLLMHLVSRARAVLFPSLYEGFGLPVLEAMQLGVPVITSNKGSLPEVGGDAALALDPYDVPALAAAIRRVDREPELREQMAQRGREQAARFSFDEHRRRLHALYSQVLATPRR